MLFVVFLLVAALLAALGFVFASGKGSGLISGYNTASDEEKAKIDEKKLCRAMSGLMFVLAACWFVAAFGALLHLKPMMWAGQGLFLAAIVVGVIRLNTGNRFQK